MGNISGTRRISFNNNFAVGPALLVEKSLGDANNSLMEIDDFAPETQTDFIKRSAKDVSLEDSELDYWAQRLNELKKEHQHINEIMEAEYNKTYEDTLKICEPRIVTQKKIVKVQPLSQWRAKIIKCYDENPHQTLMCSSLIQAFIEGVASCRMEEAEV